MFKIIPVLNPDGVARGHWRFDTNGVNLNRKYDQPCPYQHPSIYAAKNKILEEHERGNLKLYVDFHAYKTRRGCFIFGNSLEDIDQQVEAKIIPKLMSLNCVNFDFRASSFSDSKNNVKDWQGESRCNSSRAVIHRETDYNPLVYTLEANYARGKHINHLSPRYDQMRGCFMAEDSPIQDSFSELYGDIYELVETTDQQFKSTQSPAPFYTPAIWQDVGQALLVSILDYDGINPQSRLISSKDGCVQSEVQKIREKIKKNI